MRRPGGRRSLLAPDDPSQVSLSVCGLVGDLICGRPIVVREAVGDRVPGVTEWNLFDIDAKFGDVEPLDVVLTYLENCASS